MSTILGSVTLDHDLDWIDEFAGSPVAGTGDHTIEGGYVTQRFSLKQGSNKPGRPITLAGANDHGWQQRSTVLALEALAEEENGQFQLTINAGETEERTFQVKFNHASPPAFKFDPVTWVSNPSPGFWYFGILKLVEVG